MTSMQSIQVQPGGRIKQARQGRQGMAVALGDPKITVITHTDITEAKRMGMTLGLSRVRIPSVLARSQY